MSVLDAFKAADQVLLSGVQGITDLITTPGLINLDFADVKSVMSGAGSALMGTGSSRGDDRAVAAAEMAISSPLLEASIDGAHGVLLSIQGGSDLGLFEINEAAQLVSNSAAVDANIIFGAVIDDALGDEVRVTVIAAGLDQGRAGHGASGADAAGSSFGASASPAPAPAPRLPRPVPAPPPVPAPAPAPRPAASNGSSPAVPGTNFVSVAGSVLGAPVPDDGIAASSGLAAEASPGRQPRAGATADRGARAGTGASRPDAPSGRSGPPWPRTAAPLLTARRTPRRRPRPSTSPPRAAVPSSSRKTTTLMFLTS